MMTVIAREGSVSIDLGTDKVSHGEMTTDMLRIISAVLMQMERVEGFEEHKGYVRQRQYEALEVWKNAILGMEIAVEDDLTNDQKRKSRKVVEDFMAAYYAATREGELQ